MPRNARPLPALGSSFTVRAALDAGASAGRLRALDLDLDRPFRGVRALRPSLSSLEDEALTPDEVVRIDVLRRSWAYAHVMPEHAFFVGRTAAVIYGLPISHADAEGDDLRVGVLAPYRALVARGIRGQRASAALTSVREHASLRVASPASVWAMLGADLTARELVVLGDAIVRIPRGPGGRRLPAEQHATIAQLRAATACPRRRHRSKLEHALAQIRVGSMSPLESEFRIDAAQAGLPEAALDVEIRNERGRLLGIADLAYPEHRTLVEVEGDHHRTTRAQWNRDIEKHAAYVAAGWEVVRLTSSHIRGRRPRAVDMVRDVLERRDGMR